MRDEIDWLYECAKEDEANNVPLFFKYVRLWGALEWLKERREKCEKNKNNLPVM